MSRVFAAGLGDQNMVVEDVSVEVETTRPQATMAPSYRSVTLAVGTSQINRTATVSQVHHVTMSCLDPIVDQRLWTMGLL